MINNIKQTTMGKFNKQRQNLEQHLMEKAMKDDVFRNQLMNDPKGTIERETSMKLPDKIKITVLEENQQYLYLVIPSVEGTNQTGELNEQELMSVSGGFDWSIATVCGSCSANQQYTNP